MPRVFASLAVATLTLFALTAGIALADGGSAPDRHVLVAVGTLLISCFTQVAGFTYLTVTGKVVAQAVHLASLDAACPAIVKRYKRSFTRYLAVAIIAVVLASATGGAAWRSREALAVHIPAAMIAAIIHVWVFRRQHQVLRRNADLVETTLKDYSAWRVQRVTRTTALAGNAETDALSP
jgi:hypothetical protein